MLALIPVSLLFPTAHRILLVPISSRTIICLSSYLLSFEEGLNSIQLFYLVNTLEGDDPEIVMSATCFRLQHFINQYPTHIKWIKSAIIEHKMTLKRWLIHFFRKSNGNVKIYPQSSLLFSARLLILDSGIYFSSILNLDKIREEEWLRME